MSYNDEAHQDAIMRDEQIRHLRGLAANAAERARRWNLLADAIADGLIEHRDEKAAHEAAELEQAVFLAKTDAQRAGTACINCGHEFGNDEGYTVSEYHDNQALMVHIGTCPTGAKEASL